LPIHLAGFCKVVLDDIIAPLRVGLLIAPLRVGLLQNRTAQALKLPDHVARKLGKGGWRKPHDSPFRCIEPVSVSTADRRSGTARRFPSRSRRRIRKRRTVTGMPSSAIVARKARAVGARTAGGSRGRSPSAR